MVAFLERLPKAVLERAATKGAPDAGSAALYRRKQPEKNARYVPGSEHLVLNKLYCNVSFVCMSDQSRIL